MPPKPPRAAPATPASAAPGPVPASAPVPAVPAVFLLGPRKWPGAEGPEAGLRLRQAIAAENAGRAGWIVMEEDLDGPADEADHAKVRSRLPR